MGVVSAIAGQSRVAVELHRGGRARRHGADGRCAAMRWCAAAEFVWRSRRWRAARRGWSPPSARCDVEPGASNVIPGRATLSLDVRHQDDAICAGGAARGCRQQAAQIAAAHKVESGLAGRHGTAAVPCGPALTAQLARAVAAQGTSCWPAQRRGPRWRGAGGDHRDRHAVRALRRRHQPQPGRVGQTEDVAVAMAVLGRFWTTWHAEYDA